MRQIGKQKTPDTVVFRTRQVSPNFLRTNPYDMDRDDTNWDT